ncbi:hypothetical protein, partial [Streptomyces sp. NPDC093094]|uniref:hypothetical protein n=1 Tax=Streptomyces sp. NPDC093094 TaxID=3366026 RepID=UPI003800C069
MSRALPKYDKRRVVVAGGVAAVLLSGAVIAGSALAGEPRAEGRTTAAPGRISCPDVRAKLPAVPASARAEVERNLTLLDTQITEAGKRLVDTVGQGGPDFVDNAILGPLKSKRAAAIDRIAISIDRTTARPQGLEALAGCVLGSGGAAPAAPQAPGAPAAPQGQAAAAPGRISCPDVRAKLPAVPASARAEVERNLTLLDTQIAEAGKRLVDTVGQGGPDFVDNAILGPLKSKRA